MDGTKSEKKEFSTPISMVGFEGHLKNGGKREHPTTRSEVEGVQTSNVVTSGARNHINSMKELHALQLQLQSQNVRP